MKRLFITVLMVMLLSGCGLFSRGNYEKNRSGFAIDNDLIISYHTNSIGEIDVIMIDQIMSYLEALDYTSFDTNILDSHATISSVVTEEELLGCGVEFTGGIPRFIRIGHSTYFYNIREKDGEDDYCTYDEYEFHKGGYSEEFVPDPEVVSPIEKMNILRFRDTDFTINTFQDILFIENVYYDADEEEWIKELVTALPMSLIQSGNIYENNTDTIKEIKVLETYILANQSINLLTLREDYKDEDVNNIWSEETIETLGRDHELIKQVRLKNAGEILELVSDTLSKLGMFQ